MVVGRILVDFIIIYLEIFSVSSETTTYPSQEYIIGNILLWYLVFEISVVWDLIFHIVVVTLDVIVVATSCSKCSR